MEYNCSTMVCQFLLYNKVNQLYVSYIPISLPSCISLPPTLPIPPLQVEIKHGAGLPVLCDCFPLAIYFTFGSVYMSMPLSHFVKIWNTSRICMSALHRGHDNLLCIVPVLVHVLPKRALPVFWTLVTTHLSKATWNNAKKDMSQGLQSYVRQEARVPKLYFCDKLPTKLPSIVTFQADTFMSRFDENFIFLAT